MLGLHLAMSIKHRNWFKNQNDKLHKAGTRHTLIFLFPKLTNTLATALFQEREMLGSAFLKGDTRVLKQTARHSEGTESMYVPLPALRVSKVKVN